MVIGLSHGEGEARSIGFAGRAREASRGVRGENVSAGVARDLQEAISRRGDTVWDSQKDHEPTSVPSSWSGEGQNGMALGVHRVQSRQTGT